MKYIKLTFQYMRNKHFWKLMLFAVVPSILISLVSTFNSTIKLFIGFFNLTDFDFKSIHHLINDVNLHNVDWWYYLAMFAIMVMLSLILAVFIGTMQRHMRTGKFQITNIFKRINENFVPSFLSILSIYFLLFIYGIAVSLVTSIWFSITKNNIATFILSLVFMVIAFVIMVFIISLFSMTAPNIVCTGQKIRDSISISIRTAGSKLISLSIAFVLPLIPLFGIQIGISFTNIRVLQYITDTLMMLFICCYYPVLVFVSYYDLFDRDREDMLPENRL